MSDILDDSQPRGACFSPCGRYRYSLWRIWDHSRLLMLWIMLNPSTADVDNNDPTVERCERRARSMGYGGVAVGNIFALRSTDPKALYTAEDPVGPANDRALRLLAMSAGIIVCGWGNHGKMVRNHADIVAGMLTGRGHKLHALRITKQGQPQHPLYVGYRVVPKLWRPATESREEEQC